MTKTRSVADDPLTISMFTGALPDGICCTSAMARTAASTSGTRVESRVIASAVTLTAHTLCATPPGAGLRSDYIVGRNGRIGRDFPSQPAVVRR
jgi:hypothetical protein